MGLIFDVRSGYMAFLPFNYILVHIVSFILSLNVSFFRKLSNVYKLFSSPWHLLWNFTASQVVNRTHHSDMWTLENFILLEENASFLSLKASWLAETWKQCQCQYIWCIVPVHCLLSIVLIFRLLYFCKMKINEENKGIFKRIKLEDRTWRDGRPI